MKNNVDYDVAIIGAGPAGAIAAGLLCQNGHSVCVIERSTFPRFSIGESLLPQCMEFIEEAGMMDAVKASGFQNKTGADFFYKGNTAEFDFSNKSTPGHDKTFQVKRMDFDHVLIKEAEKQGAVSFYETSVEGVDLSGGKARLDVSCGGKSRIITARFCLDASGYGRVLPRLLKLDKPSSFPSRMSLFTHVQDNIDDPAYNRDHIFIGVHPQHKGVWYWLIPFSDGRASIGVVGADLYCELKDYIADEPHLSKFLKNAKFDTDIQKIQGYATSVDKMYGENFAILGNAAEFLDPVFSSGVTIAMKSASLAASVLNRKLKGEAVYWEKDFAEPLKIGLDTFRAFVEAWYDGTLIDVLFSDRRKDNPNVERYIISILAGYAWDETNPYVKQPQKRLKSLREVC